MNEEKRTAYHEAGHAVVAFGFGYRIERVSILRPRFGSGRGRAAIPDMLHEDNVAEELRSMRREGKPRDEAEARLSEWAKRDAVILMAGRAADELFAGDYNHHGVRSDLRQMMLECITQDPSEQTTLRDESLQQATESLRQNWPKVETITRTLLAKKGTQRARLPLPDRASDLA